MKVALVHDDLVQWGGAERVLLAIAELFPDAPIFTSVFDRAHSVLSEKFAHKKIITSFMQKMPGWRNFYKALLPFYPIAFEQFDFSGYDLVISQTTKFAKAIITKPQTKHICYCHTPPRFLWNFSGEQPSKVIKPYLSYLRIYDAVSARRVDHFIAGSINAQKRIKKVYQQDCQVVLPFVDLENYKALETFDGNYYLVISRLNGYKKVDVAIKALNKLGKNLKIIGTGPQQDKLKSLAAPNIEILGQISEDLKLNLLSGCKALIVCAEEDFGLTPLEAQACGKPVIAYGIGGVLETVVEGKTGIFYNEQTEESLIKALQKFERMRFNPEICQKNAQKFSKQKFQENLLNTVNKLLQ